MALTAAQARSIMLRRCFGDNIAPACARLWLNIPRSEQILAEQVRKADAERVALYAEPMPAGLCARHDEQHRRWGWHDSAACMACKRPQRQLIDELTEGELQQ
jgi:hypothetical protein